MLSIANSSIYAQESDYGLSASSDISVVHDDNIYRVIDELSQSDTYLSIAPSLNLVGGYGKQRYELSYDGDYAKFADAEDADFYDHEVVGKINFEHTLKLSSEFEAGYIDDHEEPGSINRIQLDLSEYNQYNQSYFVAGIAYGQESSIGRIELKYRGSEKDYTNNDLDYLDNSTNQFTGRFTYRIAPKTKVYAETIYSKIDYDTALYFELDNTYKRYRAGISWDFTNKLSGDVNIGYQDRDYDLENLRDINGLAYNGEITWLINTYTTIAFEAKRESIDSSLEEAGGFLRTTYGLSLEHELTERLDLNADIGYSKDELVFSSSREDKRYAYKLALEYEVLRTVFVSASYTYEERDSTEALADYKANIFGITATVFWDN